MPNVCVKPYKQAMREYHELIAQLAADADRMYREDLSRRLYVCGTREEGLDTLNPKREIWASMSISEGAEDWHVSPEPTPSNLTIEQLQEWIRERIKSEPLWIFAD